MSGYSCFPSTYSNIYRPALAASGITPHMAHRLIDLHEVAMKFISALAGALGAVAIGALAFGAVAVGALAIKRMAVQDATFNRVTIHELIVDDLTVTKSSNDRAF
jgi:hypothetical protein